MHHGEPGLVPYRVKAPHLCNVDLIFRSQPSGDVHGPGRHIEVEGGAGAPEMSPLRHGLEVVDRFCRLDLDSTQQPVPAVTRCQHQVRKDLDLSNLHGSGLTVADIGGNLQPLFETDLKQPDDPVMLELLADRAHQYWAQMTSGLGKSVYDA